MLVVPLKWDVYNLQGIRVATGIDAKTGNLPPGVYVVCSGVITKKILIK